MSHNNCNCNCFPLQASGRLRKQETLSGQRGSLSSSNVGHIVAALNLKNCARFPYLSILQLKQETETHRPERELVVKQCGSHWQLSISKTALGSPTYPLQFYKVPFIVGLWVFVVVCNCCGTLLLVFLWCCNFCNHLTLH